MIHFQHRMEEPFPKHRQLLRIGKKENKCFAIKPETYSIKVVYCYRHVHDSGIEKENEIDCEHTAHHTDVYICTH